MPGPITHSRIVSSAETGSASEAGLPDRPVRNSAQLRNEGGAAVKQSGQQWLGVAADWWALGAEASLVVPLRLARLACGGAKAKAEARLMVSEKFEAHGTLLRDIREGNEEAFSPGFTDMNDAIRWLNRRK